MGSKSSKISKEILIEFIAEGNEILQRVSDNLAKIEKGECSKQVIDETYRDMHTLKGSAQLFGLKQIGDMAHAMETVLDPLRKKTYKLSHQFIDRLYRSLDMIETLILSLESDDLEQFDKQIDVSIGALIQSAEVNFEIGSFITKDNLLSEEATISDQVAQAQNPGEVIDDLVDKTYSEDVQQITSNTSRPVSVNPNGPQKSNDQLTHNKPVVTDLSSDIKEENKKVENNMTNEEEKTETGPVTAKSSSSSSDSTIRVHVDLLDRLMNLVGEIVLVRNQVLQYSSKHEDLDFLNLSQSLDIVTSDLQSEVMKTRMQPIGNVLNKYQRVVRDIARDLDKKIELTLVGTETELDKTLLEAIKDPLTHIVRNSCDHGIETPEVRVASGKAEEGHVTIKSFHEGGQVIIQISDDGKGLDRDKILHKALERDLINPEAAERMTDKEVYQLIFLPGFSTADKVSAVSGRGVGMDVVKTNIEKIGGAIDLMSYPGKGSSISLKIPLTLAIVPALIIRSGEEQFAIPQIKLVELVRVDKDDDSGHKIEELQGKPIFRLRGSLLPLVYLPEALGKESSEIDPDCTNIVVLDADGEQFGLVVDEILDTADIVVKPLSQSLKSLEVFSGATIMGDGSVALILDTSGLAHRSQIRTDKSKSSLDDIERVDKAEILNSESQEFILVELSANSNYAIPLCLVNRLEEFSANDVEFSGEQKIIRYRGSILPLFFVNEALGFPEKADVESLNDTFSVIVINKRGKNYGLVVNTILDVVEIHGEIDDTVKDREGIFGNVIHDEKVIVILDAYTILNHYLSKVSSDYSSDVNEFEVTKSSPKEHKKTKVLFSEDTAFFRRQVVKFLESSGYEVEAYEDGQQAYDRLASADKDEFQLVLTDIEMPVMNGYDLARKVRETDTYSSIPLIAVTTRFREVDIEEGKNAGFNAYLEKLNKEVLIEEIEKLLKAA